MMESFGSSAQNQLLDYKRWTARIPLLNAMFDYIEVFYNRRRHQQGLGDRTPAEAYAASPAA